MSDRQALKNILEKLYDIGASDSLKLQLPNKVGNKAKARTVKQAPCPNIKREEAPLRARKKADSCKENNKSRTHQASLRKSKGHNQPVQELEQRYGQLKLTPIDHSECQEDMPGVKRPAPGIEVTADASVKVIQASRTSPRQKSTRLQAAEQTPTPKLKYSAQRRQIFVDLTAHGDEELTVCEGAADSPMSTGLSPQDKVSAA